MSIQNIKPNKNKGCLVSILIAGFLVLVLPVIIILIGISTDKIKSDFRNVTETTKEQETNIIAILNNCGITKVTSIVADESLNEMNVKGEKGYRITFNNIKNIILYLKPNKSINMIRYADNNLYRNGKIISTINDYIFTIDEQTKYQILCERTIKSLLKSPSTAKFPWLSEYRFEKKNGIVTIQSYVDAQNSFGVMLRSNWQIKVRSSDMNIISLIFDGKEYIKKKEMISNEKNIRSTPKSRLGITTNETNRIK